jgi:hypothetical protein
MKREIAFLSEETKRTGNELMSIMTSDKKIAGTFEGTPTGINQNETIHGILKDSPDGSLSLLHTHTDNISFSEKDFRTLCENKSVKDLSLKTPNGTTYKAAVGGGKRAGKAEINAKIREVEKQLIEQPRYAILSDGKRHDAVFERFIRERNDIIKAFFGWNLWENIVMKNEKNQIFINFFPSPPEPNPFIMKSKEDYFRVRDAWSALLDAEDKWGDEVVTKEGVKESTVEESKRAYERYKEALAQGLQEQFKEREDGTE